MIDDFNGRDHDWSHFAVWDAYVDIAVLYNTIIITFKWMVVL